MGVRSTGSHPTTTKADGHLLEYLRQNFGVGGGAENITPNSGIQATGGVISDYTTTPGDVYRAHVFTSSGKFTVTSLGFGFDTAESVEYLVVAGGGGGGNHTTVGGGGAGGLRTNLSGHSFATNVPFPVSTSPGEYTVTVGAGGAGGESWPSNGSAGGPSSFGPITSVGGGYGGKDQTAGGAGGSGGGGGGSSGVDALGGATQAVTTPSPWPGPAVQGFAGGRNKPARTSPYTSGGGGGAGGAGVNGSADSGAGGPGIQVAIAGPTATTFTGVGAKNPANNQYQYFAGGGGAAGVYGGSAGDGGLGGGGNGRNNDFGQTGESNTGGGGGGSADPDGSSNEVAGAGGSGIVIVRYQIGTLTATAKATGGAISFYNNKTIHTFASSGTLEVPASISNVDYVILGGGGGGRSFDGGYAGGGGGAGGYILKEGQTLPAATYPIQVGAGGNIDSNGNSTSFNSEAAIYGGHGGKGSPGPGGNGGSGGGGAGSNSASNVGDGQNFPGPTQQGHPGGIGSPGGGYGGGGGGFGAAGSAKAPDGGGPGGVGVQLPASFRDPVQAPSDTTNPVPYQRGGGLGTPGPAGGFYVAGGGGGGTWSPSYGTKGGDGGAGGGGFCGGFWSIRRYSCP